MMTVRERASVTVSEPVDGTVRRRPRSLAVAKASRVRTITVDPRVMSAAKAARREGERLVIVSVTEVRLQS